MLILKHALAFIFESQLHNFSSVLRFRCSKIQSNGCETVPNSGSYEIFQALYWVNWSQIAFSLNLTCNIESEPATLLAWWINGATERIMFETYAEASRDRINTGKLEKTVPRLALLGVRRQWHWGKDRRRWWCWGSGQDQGWVHHTRNVLKKKPERPDWIWYEVGIYSTCRRMLRDLWQWQVVKVR